MNKYTAGRHLFKLVGKICQHVYFSADKLVQCSKINQSIKQHILDENIKFSIHNVSKTNNVVQFHVKIKSLTQILQLIMQSLEQLNYCVNYLGKYCYANGLSQIAQQFIDIGRGNFASVYKLKTTYGSVKAMKMFQKRHLNDKKVKMSFQNQISIMRQLKSPYLASLNCIYQTQKTFYLQMQYFSQRLKQYVKRSLTQHKQKQIMRNLLQALLQLQYKLIIHRDIKPDNIMVRRKDNSLEEFVIIDFGLSTKMEKQDIIHKRCGTPGFLAPEIVNSTHSKITSKSDIFSLGVTFFFILTKTKPFVGTDLKDVLMKNKRLIIQDQHYTKMSDKQCDLVKRMMEKDPIKRISASEALKHSYFDYQQDQNDVINEQKCDLSSKIQNLNIMKTQFLSEGIQLLFNVLQLNRNNQKTHQTQPLTAIYVDSLFHQLLIQDEIYLNIDSL